MPVGFRIADLVRQGQQPSAFLRLLGAAANGLLFSRMKASLGLQRARICYSAGGILSPEALRFYHALGVPLESVYFTTEAGLLPDVATHGSLRTAAAKSSEYVRLTDAGEIVSHSPGGFLGYYGEPQESAAATENGWFHTGDRGSVANEHAIQFVDRANSAVRLSTGDVLAPQDVESRLRSSPYIRDAWVLTGSAGAFVSAVIVINYATASRWAGQKKVARASLDELVAVPEIYALIKGEIERVNAALPSACRVRRYALLPRTFDADEGELTRTGNLRRAFLGERYRELVEALYAGREKAAVPLPKEGDAQEKNAILTIASIGETVS